MADKFPQPRPASAPPASSADQLFRADYDHVVGEATCSRCWEDQQLARVVCEESGPRVHWVDCVRESSDEGLSDVRAVTWRK